MVEPNGGCVILLIVCVVYYLFKEIGKWLDKLDNSHHVCPQAFEDGWAEPLCRAMIERDMRYYQGEWIPKYEKDDRNDEALKARLLKKGIALNKYGKWYLTGDALYKTLDKIYKK